MMWKSISLSG